MRRFISQETAKRLDEVLVTQGYSIDQLMELAGLAVAQSVYKEFQPSRVLIVCGPGNNGGDGLVAARHLKLFGFSPEVFYPKRTVSDLYSRLTNLLTHFRIPIHNSQPNFSDFPLLIDAIFGFSFKGEVREPFKTIIDDLNEAQRPIVSVDIPSGWDVELGDLGTGVHPYMLVSLSAPKLGVQGFTGVHYLGGRFVSESVWEELGLPIPEYPGTEQIVKLSNP